MSLGQLTRVAVGPCTRQDATLLSLGASLKSASRQRRLVQRGVAHQAPCVAAGLLVLVAHIFGKPQPATRLPHHIHSTEQQPLATAFTFAAVSCGLKLTHACMCVARTVCDQLAKDALWIQQSASAVRLRLQRVNRIPWRPRQTSQPSPPQLRPQSHSPSQGHEQQHQSKKALLASQLLQAQSMLQQHRPDKELLRVIKSLGDSSIPLDTKWMEFTQRLASHGHDAISDSMRSLFTAAGESSQAVQALLSPEQQSQELWKSARTQCVIQQEQAFKQMVFNQLLMPN